MRGKAGRVQTVLMRPRNAGAPPFPATLEAVDQLQSVVEIAEDFETQSSWLTHVQIERTLGSATAFAVAYAHTAGRHLPVLVDENLIPTGPVLADGRPTYSDAISPATRVDPRFTITSMSCALLLGPATTRLFSPFGHAGVTTSVSKLATPARVPGIKAL